MALVAERTKSAELSDHTRSRDVVGGCAINAGVGADDLRNSVAQLAKCVFRAFLAGSGSGCTVQSSRPSADVLDNAANSDGVDAVVHERLERSCAEDFVHVVAKG